ncbi:MAG: hypothetical protein ACRDT8_26345, partial [Micromonosporaceae bacterium]
MAALRPRRYPSAEWDAGREEVIVVAMPAEAAQPSPEFPWRPPFTVDLLFELPDTGLRYEV